MRKPIKFTSVKLIFQTISLIGALSLLIAVSSFAIRPFTALDVAIGTPGKISNHSNQYQSKTNANPEHIAQKQLADAGIQAGGLSDTISDSTTKKSKIDNSFANPITTQKNKITKPRKRNNYLFLRIFGDKNVIQLKTDLIIFGNEHYPPFLRKFHTRVIEKTYSYPVILLFIFLIFIFILNVVLVLLVLYYSNLYKNQKARYIRIFTGMYEEVLTAYLFNEINWAKTLIKLKRIKKPLNRKILTSVLSNFQGNLSGEMDNRIPEIYEKLDLYRDALKLTKSSFYYNKVVGINELTNLYPQGALRIIDGFINDKHYLVRAEAQKSFIRIHASNPFEFLRTLTTPFTRWTQLSIFYLFRLHQLSAPAFIDYLNTENDNVRNFCLRMIIYFQQLENATEIFKLFESKNERTRFLSFRAINDLRLYEGKDLIKSCYSGETKKNRLEIIKALKNIGNTDDFDFLESIIKTSSTTEKTEACRSLYFMNKEGCDRLNFMIQYSDRNIEQYLAHITDPRN